MTTPTMIPCPFCEAMPARGSRKGVQCACGAEGPFAATPAKAIEKWNTRPVEAALREALRPFAAFAEHWDKRPHRGGMAQDDEDGVYTIQLNLGEPPATITLGHLRAAALVLKKTRGDADAI